MLPHRERLLRIARRRLATMEDAEDCLHDALIRAACAANLDEAQVAGYLTTIVVRLCADHRRTRSAAQRALARAHHGCLDASPEDAVCDRAEATWMSERLDEWLSERERSVLRARADGLSTRQTAEQLNITR